MTEKKGARVTTKRGDSGTTDLFGGVRVNKSSEVVKIIGCCDMTQAVLGLVKIGLKNDSAKDFIALVQKRLYECMAELARAQVIPPEKIALWVQEIEEEQKKLQETTSIAHRFVIPGENSEEAWCQFARAQVRILEHELYKYIEQDNNNQTLTKYGPFINRLSDYFFVLSQTLIT